MKLSKIHLIAVVISLLLAHDLSATTYGPPSLMDCPGSDTPVKFRNLTSTNNFSAKYWSDGYVSGMPQRSWLKKHPTDDVLFWGDDCEKIATLSFSQNDKGTSRDADKYDWAGSPGLEDFAKMLKGSQDDTRKLKYLRTKIWHLSSDKYRQDPDQAARSQFENENLSALFQLLDRRSSHERMMMAEIARQQGDFEVAEKLLDYEFPPNQQVFVRFLLRLVNNTDTVVRQYVASAADDQAADAR